MKWVTWECVGVDRMGCAWLIRKHIDPKAKFFFVPMRTESLPAGAEPFDIPGARFSHHQGHCSFHVEPAAAGLDLICEGLRQISPDDATALERGALIYDALYARLAAETKNK